MRIHLLTCAGHAGLAPDDRYLLAALRARGVSAEPVVWEDPLVAWDEAELTVVRSTWDYTFRREAFLRQLAHIAQRSLLVNPLDVIAWSSHKQYLLELEQRGVPIVPTELVRQGEAPDLGSVATTRGWSELVVKPAVGAGGQWTRRFDRSQVAEAQAHLERVLAHEDALVQPFLPAIEAEGEVSLVCIDGELSHAVHKRGAPGDFRIHEEHGGQVAATTPTDELKGLALRALTAVPAPPCYARVDVVRGLDGRPCVMELELVEPELFFGASAEGTARMADALLSRLRR